MRKLLKITVAVLLLSAAVGSSAQMARQAGRVFAGAIDDAQIINIWGKGKLNPVEARSVLAATKNAQSIRGLAVFTTASVVGTMADELERQLKSATEGVFTIIGHNDNGQIRLADGSGLPLHGIGERTGGASVALVSCQSLPFVKNFGAGLAAKVEIDVAVAAESIFQERLQNWRGAPPSPEQLQDLLDSSVAAAARAKQSDRLVKVGTGLTVGGGITVVAIQKRG
jgi:hypothetical protein